MDVDARPKKKLASRLGSPLRSIWSQILLAFLAGAWLSRIDPLTKYWGVLHDIGIALLVAAIVTIFWHLREFSDFFERFARAILIEDEHLANLSISTLTRLRSRAGRHILSARTDNPNYDERNKLADEIDAMIFGNLLSSKEGSSGMYREKYRERITIEAMSFEAALREVGTDPAGLPADVLKATVHKITTVTSYTIIAPFVAISSYDVKLNGRYADMPASFPIAKRLSLRAGHSESKAVDIKINVTNRREGGIDVEAVPCPLPLTNGGCDIWTEMVEYRSPSAEAHILNTMSLLTRGFRVDLFQSGPGPFLVFDGGFVAPNAPDPEFGPHSIHLEYDGWLFEDQGYNIWWWAREQPSQVQGSAPAQLASGD